MTSAAKKQKVVPASNPMLEALKRAPLGEPLSDDERRAIEEARALDKWIPGPQVTAEIAERRRRAK